MGGGSNVYAPSKDQLGSANSQFTNLLGQTTGAIQGYLPSVAGTAQNLVGQYQNNPYQPQAQAGAGTASAYGTGTLVPQLQQGATALAGAGGAAAGYVPQALATGFDPQNALYARNYQQMLDQQNAINAMNGVSGTPYAAGITGQAGQNFNMDWLNQALGRQSTAAGTAANLIGGASTGYTGAGNVGTGAINTEVGASGLPSSVYGTNIMNDLAALSGANQAISGATGINDQVMGTILQYLGYGTNAQLGKEQQANANSPLAALGSLFGMNTGGGGTLGGDLIAALPAL